MKVLDKGFLLVVDKMGDDTSIVNAARVSYNSRPVSDDRKLINYLITHEHMSPFEMCEITFHVKAPIFVARQWFRHRTGSYNEISGRYSVLKEEYYVPEKLYGQSEKNKQSSGEELNVTPYYIDATCMMIFETYNKLIEMGVSREQARMILPLNTYTEFYFKTDLRNLLHFLELRCSMDAQYEIRQYALAIKDIVKAWVPLTYEAWNK